MLRVTSENDSSKFDENWKDGFTTLKGDPAVDTTSPAKHDSIQPEQMEVEESSSDELGKPFQDFLDASVFKVCD